MRLTLNECPIDLRLIRRSTQCAGLLALFIIVSAANAAEPKLRCIEPDARTGSSAAVVVGDVPLVQTGQMFSSPNIAGDVDPLPVEQQIKRLFRRLDATLEHSGSRLGRAVKLNFYVTEWSQIRQIKAELARQFPGEHKPAVAFIVTRPADQRSPVSVDAIAMASQSPGRSARIFRADGNNPAVSLVPDGTRIYVSGQASRNESLGKATRGTLEQLHETLRFLRRRPEDILQIKCFLQPMSKADAVRAEIKRFFGSKPVPPVSLVEWQSGATVPIEIEIVAFGGRNRTGPVVEYLTPPGMKASPVFSRVARINHSRSIYISGLYPAEESSETIPEVEQLFSSLKRVLKKSGGDLSHLVKATYYVSADHTSRSLNELRPMYYDPERPPAASKAKVADVGQTGAGITLDMIAVPAGGPELSEYGPAEFGHGLSADEASAGWISLFDGRTTYGWTGASVSEGLLSGGRTNSKFQAFEIRAKSKTEGLLRIGKRFFPLNGDFSAKVEAGSEASPQTISLGKGLQIEELAIRPIHSKVLFDKVISEWRPIDRESIPDNRRPKWSVQDGVLRAVGGPGCVKIK